MKSTDPQQTLYDPSFEHDNCGIGAVVDIHGRKSHQTVDDALKIVEHLEHRAGKDATGETGDGVGIMTQVPHAFFRKVCEPLGIALGEAERSYGVGTFFFPQDGQLVRQAKKMFEIIVEKEGLRFLGWREVDIAPKVLGEKALASMPRICQGFVARPETIADDLAFDRKLYIVRRIFEQSNEHTYVPSLSCRTIVYKGMFLVGQLRTFFCDLQDESYASAFAIVHSRFSTNTNPSWLRAHPNRYLVHNGEINTIRGNVDKMLVREETVASACFTNEDLTKVLPIISMEGSDSAMLDNALEFMIMGGMDPALAAMVLIPEPWENNGTISQEERDFYQYYATMMEPWDGPASILFSDGDVMGAILDRNGLRPSRYLVTDDGRLILSSEVGVLPIDERHIVKKERLHPGKLLLVDMKAGVIRSDAELKSYYANREPYGEWLDMHLKKLVDIPIPNEKVVEIKGSELTKLQKAFGYVYEDYREDIHQMALRGVEAIGSMGVDTPLAVLSDRKQPLSAYFKQLFAQVTNPPIDAQREKIVTATAVYVGKNGNLLAEKPENCGVLKIQSPILTDLGILKLRKQKSAGLKVETISLCYYKGTTLERAIEHLYVQVDRMYRDGANILILSDRGVDEYHMAIPSLLAVSAVHHYLVKTKKCMAMSLILESAEPRGVHDFATLLGYGASAINPYLAHASIRELIDQGLLVKDYYAACMDYDNAILQGIVKIASKMGISTLQSYQGSRAFEALGIASEVVDTYFTGTVSRIGGMDLREIERQQEEQHGKAFDPYGEEIDVKIDIVGRHKRHKDGEYHRITPETIRLLQESVREGSYEKYKDFAHVADDERNGYIRSLMEIVYPAEGVPIEEVESVDEIVKRFKTGAMSYGSISEEAHTALAVAMNRLKGKSNSGEGGESLARLETRGTPDDSGSAIKQVASGRFGVTSTYLVSAEEIQIKLAQGAKPGEGGHLPGKKVYPWIAKTRHSTPGVGLISPPPHHDIYSIEDLAQLIFDLKNANKNADISVKLVSEAGVGTIAAGVAKAGAQIILISGADGGTGAASLSSIHNAGLPWELGLAETHQTLLSNGLRERVLLEVDGKLLTARDVLVAAILGAEEFGFATAPLIALGCQMLRVCHLDTCPRGIATQNPELRKKFKGKPEYVENLMRFIAEELREYMARLGVRTLKELVGRTDLLRKREDLTGVRAAISLDRILTPPAPERHTYNAEHRYDFHLACQKDAELLIDSKELKRALVGGKKAKIRVSLSNTDRTFGTLIGAEVTRRFGESLAEDTVTFDCEGAGGQSFGAFIPRGMTLRLVGDSNDYFGKGLSGGKLILRAPEEAAYDAEENVIVGNVVLYGATSGETYIAGQAGERFCVRNSGAKAVVEGVGEHGCEYMTGGVAVILGETGKNFAAGMSGGVAYVLDTKHRLYRNLNKEMVLMENLKHKADKLELRLLLENHVRYTGSKKAKAILEDFELHARDFKKVIPVDYREIKKITESFIEQGFSLEDAQMEAFNQSVRG